MNKIVKLFNNKLYFISLIGTQLEINKATIEIKNVVESLGHTTKVVSIIPYVSNEWKDKIRKVNKENKSIIINKIGNVSCSQITDFNREVRNLDLRHPWAFKIKNKNGLYKINCDQINQIYSLQNCMKNKINDIKMYIK